MNQPSTRTSFYGRTDSKISPFKIWQDNMLKISTNLNQLWHRHFFEKICTNSWQFIKRASEHCLQVETFCNLQKSPKVLNMFGWFYRTVDPHIITVTITQLVSSGLAINWSLRPWPRKLITCFTSSCFSLLLRRTWQTYLRSFHLVHIFSYSQNSHKIKHIKYVPHTKFAELDL